MWQLDLLGDVLPAFTAYARQKEEECDKARGTSASANDLYLQALECFNDLDVIDKAVTQSRGEWTPGLDEKVIHRLLETLNSRVESRSTFSVLPFLGPAESGEKYSKLRALKVCIQSLDDESSDEEDQETSLYEVYKCGFDQSKLRIHLLSRKESPHERKKFFARIQEARRHLLNHYYKEYQSGSDDVELSQHPSFGVKALAKTAYNLLEKHSRCKCRPSDAKREIRLSLTEHRLFQLRHSSRETVNCRPCSADFKVLLPECQAHDDWKVTNIHVQSLRAKASKGTQEFESDKKLIKKNICDVIQESKITCIHLLVSKDKLWALRPPPPVGSSRHTSMQSLRNLLGSGRAHSSRDVARYGDKEKLLLSYILATSLLYLYPSKWMMPDWSSENILFPKISSSGCRKPSPFTLPYLSISLQQTNDTPKAPPVSQYHKHPSILALGIMLLEIATGMQFDYAYESGTKETNQSDRYNEYGSRALSLLNDLERRGERRLSHRIPPVLFNVIRSCLILSNPPTMAAEQMSEEGPIRHYILSCIVIPLASELSEGYHISLDKIQEALRPDSTTESYSKIIEQARSKVKTSIAKVLTTDLNKPDLPPPVSWKETEFCLYGEKEEFVDKSKLQSTIDWFSWLKNMQGRVYKLQQKTYKERIKVAILDSGLDLSEDQAVIYDERRDLEYKSWIDGDDGMRKDEVGHGTHLATLLSRIAPEAHIHVARVFQKGKPNMRREPRNVARAIRHAVDIWKVDIIVMAFGFDEEQTAPTKEDSLSLSIQHAAFNGIAMFAAASNDGKNRRDGVAWPASASEVICVHSADGHGTPSGFTPGPCDNQRIMLLGEHVKSAWPTNLRQQGDSRLMSGTSCATSIAAGVAALLLHYARGFLSNDQWRQLRRVDQMRRMFVRLKDDRVKEYYWIRPWVLFDRKHEEGWIQGEIKAALR